MRGNATILGNPAPVEIDPSDIIDDLAFVFDFHLDGAKKHEGFWLDVTYLNLEPSEETPGGTIETDLDITLAEAFGFHRVTHFGARSASISHTACAIGTSKRKSRSPVFRLCKAIRTGSTSPWVSGC